MIDRNVQYPNRYMVVPVDGSDNLVDLIPAPGEIYEEGTLLNKATLLSDETASIFELTSEDPTVNEALKKTGTALSDSVRIASGSYVGTGTYGASHPSSLAFDFEPEVLFVFKGSYKPAKVLYKDYFVYESFSNSYICFLRGGNSVAVSDTYIETSGGGFFIKGTVTDMPYSMNNGAVSWYFNGESETDGPSSQMNDSGITYHYIAIGKGSSF